MTDKGYTLVTGGAGYIGSHFLLQRGPQAGPVVVFDNLTNGHREALPDWAEFVQGDLCNPSDVKSLFQSHAIEDVIHFAALAEVGESMADPLRYYHNNILGGLHLLEACAAMKVKTFLFSSTTATYGVPKTIPIPETTLQMPVNPYGESKLAMERMLLALGGVTAMRIGILRYFNVAGADPEGRVGEDHQPESHLIPNLLLSLLRQGEDEGTEFQLHGDDYETPDGTCIRDYVHVSDLADAHLKVVQALQNQPTAIYNVGSGTGHSVKEILQAVERVTGRQVAVNIGPRRPGDPPKLIADSSRIRHDLQWQPVHDLDTIISTAWNWHSRHPQGYTSS